MKTEEAINFLKDKGYKIEEPKYKFAQVILSEEKNVLLTNKKNATLIWCWSDEKKLNDFEWLKNDDASQFWINSNIQPVELKLNGKWVKFDEVIEGRFLK